MSTILDNHTFIWIALVVIAVAVGVIAVSGSIKIGK